MRINYKQPLLDFDGKPLRSMVDGEPKEMTIKSAFLSCLSVALPGDESIPPLEKVKLGQCGVAIQKGIDLTTEDVSKLKERVCRMYASPVVAWSLNVAIEEAPASGKK